MTLVVSIYLFFTLVVHPSDPLLTFVNKVTNTRQLYLSVLQNGLSLISINLPSLWCLFSQTQLESVLRSIRSIISLRSSGSATSLSRKPASRSPLPPPPLAKHRRDLEPTTDPNSSEAHLGHLEAQSFDTYAMHDIIRGDSEEGLPRGKIRITDSITQSTASV